jgi:hypothetical protein
VESKKPDDGGGSEGRKFDMKGSGGSARYPFLLKVANFNAAVLFCSDQKIGPNKKP